MSNIPNLIIDGHCDTLKKITDKELSIYDESLMFKLKESSGFNSYIQFLASYVATRNVKKVEDGVNIANTQLDKLYFEYKKNKDSIFLIKSKSDLEIFEKNIKESEKENNNKVGIVLTIENGAGIGEDIENISKLYNRGVRVMSITWNDDNLLGCGTSTINDKGLTLFGRECIKIMNEKKMIVDISHASKKTVSDVLEISSRPVIATHSCVHNICNHTRNLTDEEIKKIADNKGVIGICFYKDFLTYEDNATSADVVAHIDYIVNLVGIDHVGFGSDFDGMKENESPIDIKTTKDFNNIFSKLNDLGYTKADIEKIAGGNFRRILSESL